uniref:tRNA endonuclease ANKZF1 isoform X2 n=1 Tax=Pristiophorus japonicus TaxID=55135 RepID=UPI00398F3879
MAAVRSVFEAAGPARGLQLVEGPGLGLGLGHGQGQGRGEQAADLGPDTAGSDEVSGSTNEGRPLPEISDKMYCSACQCNFDRREDQTEHYKLDWHRFNLRQRLMGAQPVTAESFEKIAGEISSISGSDSEESGSDSEPERLQCRKIQNVVCLEGEDIPGEGQPRGRRGHRVIFRSEDGEYLSVYRCILQGKQDTREDEDEDTDSLLWSLHSLNPQTIWVVLMTGGGHFAGAVFRGSEPLQHKTFHRYTVRAKRGVAQGARDGQNRSRAPRSAGASLRRYNEAALVKDVEDLLANWSESLRVATAIFLRAPSYNRSIFFSGKDPPLSPSDARLRTIPFPTRRATFKEVKRVHAALSSMEIYARDTDIAMIHSPQRRVWKQKLRTEREGSGSERDGERDDCEAEAVNPADLPCSLEMVEESLGTLELKEFDVSPKKKRKKKKKKVYAEKTMGRGAPDTPEEGDDETTQTDCTKAADPGTRPLPTEERDQAKRRPKKIQTTLAGTSEEETERYRVRNELYTACKTGDLEHLRKLLCNVLLLGVTELGHSGQTESTNQAAESAVETDREQGSETDREQRDKRGQSPYAVSADKQTRNEFRRYMADHPGRYDYTKAQISAPLTSEIESEKAEKKRAQKAAKKLREKEQKKQKQRLEEEEIERKRYSAMSEREKRALAAEKRFAQQLVNNGTSRDIRRCWLCGQALDRVPFEYLDYTFCTTHCLQEHRKQQRP